MAQAYISGILLLLLPEMCLSYLVFLDGRLQKEHTFLHGYFSVIEEGNVNMHKDVDFQRQL